MSPNTVKFEKVRERASQDFTTVWGDAQESISILRRLESLYANDKKRKIPLLPPFAISDTMGRLYRVYWLIGGRLEKGGGGGREGGALLENKRTLL